MNENLPHRVIYRCGTKCRAKVFTNLAVANKFVEQQKHVVHIQLATDPIPEEMKSHSRMPNRNECSRVPCKCGKGNRLTSEEFCYACSGAAISRNPV